MLPLFTYTLLCTDFVSITSNGKLFFSVLAMNISLKPSEAPTSNQLQVL